MTEVIRIPHGDNPVEIRQAFQRLKRKSENIDISDDTNLAVTSPIVLTDDTLSLNLAATDHDGLLNFVADEHVAHAGVSITTAANSGLAGGGTIASTRTLVLDINNLAVTTKIDPGDFIPHWDITATAVSKKITFANFESYINHDNLAGFVANEHIDWTNTSSALLTSSSGQFANVGIGTAATTHQLDILGTPVAPAAGAINALNILFQPSFVDDCTIANYALSFVVQPSVSGGYTNLGTCASILGSIVSGASHAGTQRRMSALQVQYGISAGTGTVTFCYGLALQAYQASGTISLLADLLISAPITGGTVTNQWSIYGLNPADSYLIGPLGLGSTTPDARLEIETIATEGKQAVTIDQNDADQAFVDFQGTSAASAANNISTWTVSTLTGHVRMEVNGVEKWFRYYEPPTS